MAPAGCREDNKAAWQPAEQLAALAVAVAAKEAEGDAKSARALSAIDIFNLISRLLGGQLARSFVRPFARSLVASAAQQGAREWAVRPAAAPEEAPEAAPKKKQQQQQQTQEAGKSLPRRPKINQFRRKSAAKLAYLHH